MNVAIGVDGPGFSCGATQRPSTRTTGRVITVADGEASGGHSFFPKETTLPRPKGRVQTQQLNVMVPPDLHEQMKDAAAEQDLSMAQLVRAAVRRYLKEMAPA